MTARGKAALLGIGLQVCQTLLTGSLALAQQNPAANPAPPPPPLQSVAAQAGPAAPETRETEGETIAKCIADMTSKDNALRRRAVLILGKYHLSQQAIQAVIRALSDTDHVVRRSAVVALSEHRAIPPQARRPVFQLIVDENVHVRRIASSLLRDVVLTARFGVRTGLTGVVSAAPLQFDDAIRNLLNRGLADEDPVVRKNILTLHRYVNDLLDADLIAACFNDPDREIRVLALQAFSTKKIPAKTQIEKLAPLATDQDPKIRQEVVRILGRLGPASFAILRGLVEDESPLVRAGAVERLVQFHAPDILEHVKGVLNDSRVPMLQRTTLVTYLRQYKDEGHAILLDLARNAPAALRARAVRFLAGAGERRPEFDFFAAMLNYPAGDVRRAAVSALHSFGPQLSETQVRKLVSSPHADVRRAALQMIDKLPPVTATDIIVDLLLDDDVDIRCAALQQACQRSVPDWQLFLSESLRDPDTKIQRAATQALLSRKDALGRQIMADYMKTGLKSPDAETRQIALRSYTRTMTGSAQDLATLTPLVSDPNPDVRRTLVSGLFKLGARAMGLLRQLARDPESAVRSAAIQRLVQLKDQQAFAQLRLVVADEAVPPEERAPLVPLLAGNITEALPFLLKLAEEGPDVLHAAAVRTLASAPRGKIPAAFFLKRLDHTSTDVQQAAAVGLRRAVYSLPPADLEKVFEFPDPALRTLALQQAFRLPVPQAAKMVETGLKSENPQLRGMAARIACVKKFPDWLNIARKHLEDPSAAVRRSVALALIPNREPASRNLLQQFIAKGTDPALANTIRSELARQQKLRTVPRRR